VDVYLNGQLLQSRDLTSKGYQDVTFSWTVTAGEFGIPDQGESDVLVKALAYTSAGLQYANPTSGKAASQGPYTSLVHVQP
jgi:hypothetical protein